MLHNYFADEIGRCSVKERQRCAAVRGRQGKGFRRNFRAPNFEASKNSALKTPKCLLIFKGPMQRIKAIFSLGPNAASKDKSIVRLE